MSVKHLSILLYWLLLLAIFIPVATWSYFIIDIRGFLDVAVENVSYPVQWESIETWQLYLTCLLNAIPAIVVIWGIINLRRMLLAFSNDTIFDIQNVVYIKRFALALVLAPCLNAFVKACSSVVLSIHHPPGQKTLSIDLSSVDFYIVLVGLVFWLIGKILIKAHALALENKAFI
ncbi:MAG: DUF2975 domain-containing protein [Pseudomonadota bacterium]